MDGWFPLYESILSTVKCDFVNKSWDFNMNGFFLRFYESNAVESAAVLFDSEMELSDGTLTYNEK